MIGEAYVSIFKYYNSNARKKYFKNRPVLVVGKSDDKDYVILPISRVTNKHYLDPEYDVEITKEDFPLMNLKENSYIRAHKQSVVHESELVERIVDFKSEYNSTYNEAIKKMKKFQDRIIENAL